MFALICVSVFAALPAAAAERIVVSHCYKGDSVASINDRVEPKSSQDRPHHSFWPRKGTTEWAEYHFGRTRKLSSTEVYWFDDSPRGGCSVPQSWRILYRSGNKWMPVEKPGKCGVKRNVFIRVTFKPVETTALRIEVKLQPGRGAGIVEWNASGEPRQAWAAIRGLKFEPRSTPLIKLIRSTWGFSQDGRSYLSSLAGFRAERQRLIEAGKTDPKELAALGSRMAAFMAGRVKRLGRFACFTRYPLTKPNAANCYIWQSRPVKWGCDIRIVDVSGDKPTAKIIFNDPAGSIFDMNLSRDGRTLFFSYRKSSEKCWQLYEIGVAGGRPKKISRDGRYYEVGAIELPDGDLLYVSTRRGGYTVCQPGPCSNLYRMKRDGSNPRCVSQNTLSDFSPHMLPDGRVLFTRWEYVDRDLTYRQSLWTQNPDGTRYQLFFGNTVRDLGMFWQARCLPGRANLLVATFAPHHGWPYGAIGLIQNRTGLEAGKDLGYMYITQEFPHIGDGVNRLRYRDPFPISDAEYLVAYGRGGKFGIYLLDVCDNKQPVYSDPKIGCFGPLPLEPRKSPPAIPALPKAQGGAGNGEIPWGEVFLADVYQGLTGIKRGRVKYIQIMEQMRKTYDLTHRAYDQSPVMSYATYYAKKCWGRVEVASDGSARFKVPALREIYFQVLDAEGRELERMTSAAQLMPGETLGCIGCHEPRQWAPPTSLRRVPEALRRPAATPEPPAWGNDGVLDYVKLVQPVLDKYCIKCHSGPDPKGGYDFSGDKTRLFSMSYDNLLGRSKSYRQHDMFTGKMLPAEKAKRKPLVHFFWLLRTPTGVNQPLWTGSHASRLLEHIDTKHCGKMIPLADRQRIYAWIDADVPYYATYANSRPRSPGYRDLYTDVQTGRESQWYAKRFRGVYNKRCVKCHGPIPHPNDHGRIWDGRFAWINLTRPEFSSALTAHLAKSAGGRGLGTEKKGKGRPLFADTKDADYAQMLQAIEEGKKKMLAVPRVDMQAQAQRK